MIDNLDFETIKGFAVIIGLFLTAFGLLFTAFATLRNVKTQKVTSYSDLIKSHRDIWKLVIDNPEKFKRVLDPKANINTKSLTFEEEWFVRLILLHSTVAFNMGKHKHIIEIEQLKNDLDDLLSLPIPQLIWNNQKKYFNKDFVKFIEKRSKGKHLILNNRNLTPSAGSWKILLLSDIPEKIINVFSNAYDDEIIIHNSTFQFDKEYIFKKKVNIVIVFGYGRIISEDVIDSVSLINIHGGVLPLNKGPNPNLWAWIENMPKGVTIHYVNENIDSGDIIAQKEIVMPVDPSLNESFQITLSACIELFEQTWPLIRSGNNERQKQNGTGTIHTFKDQKRFADILTEENLNIPMSELLQKIRIRLSSTP